jgi:Lon protease-like protein
MPEELLPLFPLSVVLLPSTELPLHIFEERYKTMIGEALENRSEFGVVLAAGEGIASAGCTAAISEVVKRYPDGRLDILTLGQRRFTILELNQDLDYLRGSVDFFDDVEPSATRELRQRALHLSKQLRGLADIDAEEPQLSFLIAQAIEDLSFRQRILQSRSEADRLRSLIDYLPAYLDRMEQVERLRAVAPQNGHSHLPLRSDPR